MSTWQAVGDVRPEPRQRSASIRRDNEPVRQWRPIAALLAAPRRRASRLVPAWWRICRQRPESHETVVARFGAVEIRRLPAGCYVSTCVSGEPSHARQTALRRLIDYLNGDNRNTIRLEAERPIMQEQLGPHRWRISARLRALGTAAAAPTPCAPKVRVLPMETEFLAIVRLGGHPTEGKIAAGDMIVLDALTHTEWVASGAPLVRLHTAGVLRWLIGGHEVAVPVTGRGRFSDAPEGGGQPIVGVK